MYFICDNININIYIWLDLFDFFCLLSLKLYIYDNIWYIYYRLVYYCIFNIYLKFKSFMDYDKFFNYRNVF